MAVMLAADIFPVTSRPPVISTSSLRVRSPKESDILPCISAVPVATRVLNVVPPVTPNVELSDVAPAFRTPNVDVPVTLRVELSDVAPALSAPRVDVPVTPSVPPRVVAPVTPSVLPSVVAPVMLAVPVTSSVCAGELFPMPTCAVPEL